MTLAPHLLADEPADRQELEDAADRLGIARVPGGFANGTVAADTLGQVWSIAHPFDSSLQFPALKELQAYIRERSKDFRANQIGDPMHGLRSKFPLGCLLVPGVLGADQEMAPFMWLLVKLAIQRPGEANSRASELSVLIQAWQKNKSQPVKKCLLRVRELILGRGQIEDALQSFTEAHGATRDASDASYLAGKALIKAVWKVYPNGLKGIRPSILTGTNEILSVDTSSEDGMTLIIPMPIDGRKTTIEYERASARLGQILLAQSLLPASADCLLKIESTAVVAHLLEHSRSALAESDWQTAECCIGLLLSFTTSRALVEVFRAAIGQSVPQTASAVSLSANFSYWFGAIPGLDQISNENLDKPERSEHASTLVSKHVALPLPKELSALCAGLTSARRNDSGQLFVSDGKKLFAKVKEITGAIKEQVTPRFNELRMRMTLPSALHQTSGDPAIAQIVSGSALGRSLAPLNYYNIRSSTLTEHYAIAVGNAMGLSSVVDPEIPGTVGAEKPLTPKEKIQAGITHLQDSVTKAGYIRDPIKRLTELNNAITAYSAWMTIATVGHRGTEWIQEFGLASIEAELKVGAIVDKVSNAAHVRRLSCLSVELLVQINVLRHALKDLIDLINSEILKPGLNKERYDVLLATRCDLQRALEGRGPLFRVVDSELRSMPASMEWLMSRLPEDWKLPPNIFRHRLRTILTEGGVSPRCIYFQLGHEFDTSIAFGPESPIAIWEYAKEFVPRLSELLLQEGWTPVPARMARKEVLPHPVTATLSTDLIGSWTGTLKSVQRHWRKHAVVKRLCGESLEEARKWIESGLRRVKADFNFANPPPNGELKRDHVARMISELGQKQGITGDLIASYLAHFRRHVSVLQKKHGWGGVLPPLPHWIPREASPIGTPHIQALQLMRAARSAALSEADKRTGDDAKRRFLVLVTLLVIEGWVIDWDSLLSQLTCLSSAATLPGEFGDTLAAEIVVGSDQGPRKKCVTFSGPVALAAKAWLNTGAFISRDLASTNTGLAAYLPDALKGRATPRVFQALCSVASMARRIIWPGFMWSVSEKKIPTALPEARLLDFSANRIGRGQDRVPAPPVNQNQGSIDKSATKADRRKVVSVKQFRMLRRNFGRIATQDNFRARTSDCMEFLQNFMGEQKVHPTVRIFAQYVVQMIAGEKAIEVSSAYQNLTRIGMPLVIQLEEQSIFELTADDLEQVYCEVIAQKPEGIQRSTARTLRSFHQHFCAELPAVDWGDIFAEAAVENAIPECAIVTEAEFQSARQWLRDRLQGNQAAPRIFNVALIRLLLHARLGLRSGEIRRLRFSDIYSIGNYVLLFVRPNQFGRVKSTAGTRVLILSEHMHETEVAEFMGHVKTEMEWRNVPAREPKPLFTNAAGIYDSRFFEKTSEAVTEALVHATGDQEARPHWCRHTKANSILGTHYVSFCDWGGVRLLTYLVGASDPFVHQFYSIRTLGQARPSTSAENYFHLGSLRTIDCAAVFGELSTADADGLLQKSSGTARQHQHRAAQKAEDARSVYHLAASRLMRFAKWPSMCADGAPMSKIPIASGDDGKGRPDEKQLHTFFKHLKSGHLPGEPARLRAVPTQVALLPKYPDTQDRAQHS